MHGDLEPNSDTLETVKDETADGSIQDINIEYKPEDDGTKKSSVGIKHELENLNDSIISLENSTKILLGATKDFRSITPEKEESEEKMPNARPGRPMSVMAEIARAQRLRVTSICKTMNQMIREMDV